MRGRFVDRAPRSSAGALLPLRVAVSAFWWWLAWPLWAQAGPVAGALAVIGGLWAAIGPIGQLAVTIGLEIGVNLLAKALTPSATGSATAGISTTASFGDKTPIGFPIGRTATAGTFVYGGEWGTSGDTPNAYSTDVYVLSDLPIASHPVIWVNGQKCTINWGATPAAQGYPVTDFNKDGKDYLWVRYLDGTQLAADTFLRSKFGSDANRPWGSDMIGSGAAMVIVTALYNRDLFQNFNQYLFEPGPTAWYDISKDTTAGGSGAHRWTDPTTWEATANPKVIAYNLLRGVYHGTEWVYGGQNLAATRLPAANWIAAINACSTQIALAAGGTEDQFRCGYYITGDMEPLSVIEELDKGCSAYTAELGGVFKTLVGAPGGAIYSFTDGDVLVTREQDMTPFPGFADTHNVIQATYTEPAEQWQSKDAQDLEDAGLIAEDAGFYLPVSLTFATVPYGTQVQRLMKTALNTGRRFITHTLFLPPDAWVLEPGVDVLSWTSALFGYTDKKFLITGKRGQPGYQQQVTLLEVDPGADYSWSTADEKAVTTSFLGIVRPAPQVVTGWSASPDSVLDDGGTARRPAITVSYDGNQPDVRAVQVTVRLTSSSAVIFDSEVPYGAPAAGAKSATLTSPAFLANTAYQVRGDFLPFSGRDHTASAWLDVTTPNIAENDLPDFGPIINSLVSDFNNRLTNMTADIAQIGAVLDSQDLANYQDKQSLILKVASQFGSAVALAGQMFAAATSDINAEALIREAAIAALGSAYAGGLLEFDSTVSGSGAGATAIIAAKIRAQLGDAVAQGGWMWKATADGLGNTSIQALLQQDTLFLVDGAGNIKTAITFDLTTGAIVAASINLGSGAVVIDSTGITVTG